MELNVYGFRAKIVISGGTYSGEVDELHVVTQARTLHQLMNRLEEAVELTIDGLVKNPKEAKMYPSSVSKKLGLKIYA